MRLNPCVPKVTLAAFHKMEVLVPNEYLTIEDHVGRCKSCANLLEEIESECSADIDGTMSLKGLVREENPSVIQLLHPDLKKMPNLELLDCLDEGGGGVVFLARCLLTQRLRAVKIVQLPILNLPTSKRKNERDNLSYRIPDHPNVLRVELYTRHNNYAIYDMPYITGSDVERFTLSCDGCLSPKVACAITLQTICGLSHLHLYNVIHRDIKPSNLMIDADGVIKLIDFGLAKNLINDADQDQTQTATPGVGTLEYAAPEQLRDLSNANELSDQYSVGSTLFRLISGFKPTDNLDQDKLVLQKLHPKVDSDLVDAIFKMRHNSANARFASLTKAAISIRPFVEDSLCLEAIKWLNSATPYSIRGSIKTSRKIPSIYLWTALLCIPILLTCLIAYQFNWVPYKPRLSEAGGAGTDERDNHVDQSSESIRIIGSKANWKIIGNEVISTSDRRRGYSGLLFGDIGWGDYDFVFEFNSSTNPICTSAFFRSSENETNEFGLVWHNSVATYSRRRSNYDLQTRQPMERLKSNHWYTIKVSVRGKRMKGFLDGNLLIDTDDVTSQNGFVGFLCYRRTPGEITRFRNIKVTSAEGKKIWSKTPNLGHLENADFNEFDGAISFRKDDAAH